MNIKDFAEKYAGALIKYGEKYTGRIIAYSVYHNYIYVNEPTKMGKDYVVNIIIKNYLDDTNVIFVVDKNTLDPYWHADGYDYDRGIFPFYPSKNEIINLIKALEL